LIVAALAPFSEPAHITGGEKGPPAMPRGPRGEKRPADVIGAAIMVGRIATGEADEITGKSPNRAKGGKVGGNARARSLDPERRAEIAKKAAATRWKKPSSD
jgi:hypothetical protein